MPIAALEEWKEFYQAATDPHILQSPEWGELKAGYGWEPVRLISADLGAQALFQQLPLGFQVAYLPRGPLSKTGSPLRSPHWNDLLIELDRICRDRRAIFLKVEPDLWQETNPDLPEGFKSSAHSIQPPRTILVDITGTEDQVLNRMKSKTRYNIRLAEKHGVAVRTLEDVDLFYGLLESTSDRADFGIHTLDYYRDAYRIFNRGGSCRLFLAELEGTPLASIMVFIQGRRSWYIYGASSPLHREKMAPYLVQWEAMRWARSRGCLTYDLWGVPDYDQDVLEANFTQRSDGLWGVYRFKRGFGGQLRRSQGPWDKVYLPPLYYLYLLRSRMGAG